MGTMQVLGGLIRKVLVGVKMVGLSGAPGFFGSPVHHPFNSGTNPREMTLWFPHFVKNMVVSGL